jgi:hypothetical protein
MRSCLIPFAAASICLAFSPRARADEKSAHACDGDHDDAKGDRYWRCLAQKLTAELATANAALTSCNVSLTTSSGNLSSCATSLSTCNGQVQSCEAQLSAPLAKSCVEIHAAHPGLPDGVYTIQPVGSAPMQVHCLMSADGGGWTLVGNFPWNGTSNGTPGWNSGSQVGSAFTDLSVAFKLSDALINQIKTTAYRAHGTATHCLVPNLPDPSACQVDTTLFWSAACSYSSSTRNPHCGEAYVDAALTTRSPTGATDASACNWHWGLVSGICQVTSEMGTSHPGEHEFVGLIDGSFVHAFDGRTGEDPSMQFWVR